MSCREGYRTAGLPRSLACLPWLLARPSCNLIASKRWRSMQSITALLLVASRLSLACAVHTRYISVRHDMQKPDMVLNAQILLDGVDIRGLQLRWHREQIGLVSQEPTLFATSIARNIAHGRPGTSSADIEDAARAANAHTFICKLPLRCCISGSISCLQPSRYQTYVQTSACFFSA